MRGKTSSLKNANAVFGLGIQIFDETGVKTGDGKTPWINLPYNTPTDVLTDIQLRETPVKVVFDSTSTAPLGDATEATLALIKAKTDNLDVALSTRAVTGLTDTQLRASPISVTGTTVGTTAPANNSWAQSLSLANSATATIINIASSTAGYKINGFVGHGTGDGYFFLQIGGVTILSGRTRSTMPVIYLPLPNAVSVTTASVVALKVTNESGSTADYEATLLGS